jgi:hypothetical protein
MVQVVDPTVTIMGPHPVKANHYMSHYATQFDAYRAVTNELCSGQTFPIAQLSINCPPSMY